MLKVELWKVCLFVPFLLINEVFGSNTDILRQKKLPPCRACKIFVESFEQVSCNSN